MGDHPQMTLWKQKRGLGIAASAGKVYFFYSETAGRKNPSLRFSLSRDGINFQETGGMADIWSGHKRKENLKTCSDFRISSFADGYLLTYLSGAGRSRCLSVALSKDLVCWQKISRLTGFKEGGMIIPHPSWPGRFLLYYGGQDIKIALSSNFKKWSRVEEAVIPSEPTYPDLRQQIANCLIAGGGILIAYFVYPKSQSGGGYSLYLALADCRNPGKVIWKSEEALWKQPEKWNDKKVIPLGLIAKENCLISYWELAGEGVYALTHPFVFPLKAKRTIRSIFSVVKKVKENPLMGPIDKHSWESRMVFNPAAVYDQGKIHLIYRAVGDDDVSVFGYASSSDGIHIDNRTDKPVYFPRESFECRRFAHRLSPSVYCSGSGCGGCEDPRITKLGHRYYMTYTAWNGCDPPGVALTSIDESDFLNQRWNWKKPVIISRPNEANKNWVIFPEKIKGKFAILHSLSPRILVDYLETLDFEGGMFINSRYEPVYRYGCWDTVIRGIGPPPIRIDDGWLVFYHAMAAGSGYKIGAMVLDAENPEKILYRARTPVIEPDEWYENEGYKPGVVYSCGAVIKDNNLMIYYGAADQTTCLALAPLKKFLFQIKSTVAPDLTPIMINS